MTDPNFPSAPQPPQVPQAAPAAGAPGAPAGVNPGGTMGIVGLILSILFAIVGLIVSIVALRKSKKAGFGNVPAVVGIIIGALASLAWIIFWTVLIIGAVTLLGYCADMGPGVYEGGTIICS